VQPNTQQAKYKDVQWLALVRQQVESLRYGVVQIVVHDARVTRIERTEKLRLEPEGKTAASSTEISGNEEENNKQ
jgi:hypothetical protein